MTLKTVSFLGVWVNDFNLDSLLDLIISFAKNDHKKTVVTNHNLHSLYLYYYESNKKFREFYNQATYCHIDGVPIVYVSRLFGSQLRRTNRITYVDLIKPLLSALDKSRCRMYYLGSSQEVIEKAETFMANTYGNIIWRGRNGYFNPSKESDENKAIIKDINHFKPQILMVGMGMPRQEIWLKDNLEDINTNVALNSGACFDYLTGLTPTPPRRLSAYGLEWLFRLINEPKRLFRRYIIEPIYLIPIIIRHLLVK